MILVAAILYAEYTHAQSGDRYGIVERPSSFKSWSFPGGDLQPRRNFWFDDRRIIASTRKVGSWVAADEELSKVVLVNVYTGETEETPYRGELRCYANGALWVNAYPEPRPQYRLPGDTGPDGFRPIAGKYGAELTVVPPGTTARTRIPEPNLVTCERLDPQQHSFGPQFAAFPLLRGHGFILRDNAQPPTAYYFANPDRGVGAKSIDFNKSEIGSFFEFEIVYQDFLGGYALPVLARKSVAEPNAIWHARHLMPDGTMKSVSIPPVLSKWVETLAGVARPLFTKAGVLWIFNNLAEDDFDKAGVYVLQEDRLIRLVRGRVGNLAKGVSPDGCRLLFSVYETDFRGVRLKENVPLTRVIDFCAKGNP